MIRRKIGRHGDGSTDTSVGVSVEPSLFDTKGLLSPFDTRVIVSEIQFLDYGYG